MSEGSQLDGVIESASALLIVPNLLRQTVFHLVRAIVSLVEALARIAAVPFLIPLFGIALVGRLAQLIGQLPNGESRVERIERPQPFEFEIENELGLDARHRQEVQAAQASGASVLAELDRTARENAYLGQRRPRYFSSSEHAAPAAPSAHSHVNQRETR